MTTMSAVYRLIPSPPARVDSRKMNFSLSGSLYASICDSRSSPLVLPSMRQYWCPASHHAPLSPSSSV